MKDLIVGCVTNYSWDNIKYWVNSIDRSGFTGDKLVICYNMPFDVADELTRRNYMVYSFKQNFEKNMLEYEDIKQFNICVRRFLHQWKFLNDIPNNSQYRYVISTDVKDVVFQKNPSEWLENNLGSYQFNVSSECIRYKDEVWGKNNLTFSFGEQIYETLSNNVIYNAGVLSGKFQSFTDIALQLFLVCYGIPEFIPGGGGPDQAALNVLLNSSIYKNITRFTQSSDGWAAQLGTSKVDKYAHLLTEPQPTLIGDMVCTSEGKEYYIVHQYDRIPEWKLILENKFK